MLEEQDTADIYMICHKYKEGIRQTIQTIQDYRQDISISLAVYSFHLDIGINHGNMLITLKVKGDVQVVGCTNKGRILQVQGHHKPLGLSP